MTYVKAEGDRLIIHPGKIVNYKNRTEIINKAEPFFGQSFTHIEILCDEMELISSVCIRTLLFIKCRVTADDIILVRASQEIKNLMQLTAKRAYFKFEG